MTISHILVSTLASPAAACGMQAMAQGSCSHGGSGASGALMAGASALGWWVLSRAEKEAGKALLWSGRAVGWVLLVGGLGGFLCASLSHAGKMWGAGHQCQMHGAMGGGGGSALPPGHPPVEQNKQ